MENITKPSILIIDDHPQIRALYRTFLEFHGYACVEACDGIDALAQMKTTKFDLVITDYQMPRMDGIQLLEVTSKDPVLKTIPVIFQSGLLDETITKKALNAGASTVTQKSSSKFTILSIISTVLTATNVASSKNIGKLVEDLRIVVR